jgi:hypothetical protein
MASTSPTTSSLQCARSPPTSYCAHSQSEWSHCRPWSGLLTWHPSAWTADSLHKEHILLKKEILEYNEICHLIYDFNCNEFQKRPVLPPILPPTTRRYIHAELYTHPRADGFLRSPWKFNTHITSQFLSSYSCISFFNYISSGQVTIKNADIINN